MDDTAMRSDGFRQALARFSTSLTAEEESDFKLSSLNDVYETIQDIQERHGSARQLRNLTRIQGFLEGMDQFGKVVEVFLNTSEVLAFVWVRTIIGQTIY
jgi:hypothetical protein